MHKIIFVIGASGSGKTTIIKALEKANVQDYKMLYFDNIGVPAYTEMLEDYGSPEEWQRLKTLEWVEIIKENFLTHSNVILDGQTRPQFIEEACHKSQISHYTIILFDCSDKERTQRLINRGQPELANQQMMDWAAYLRERCQGFDSIDNTDLSEQETFSSLMEFLKK